MRNNYLFTLLLLILFNSCALLKSSKNNKPVIKQIRFYESFTNNDSIKLDRDSIFKIKNLTTRKYTKHGSFLEGLVYDSKGNLITKSVFTHNSFNKFSTNIEYKNDLIQKKSYYYYDNSKRLIKVLSYTKDSLLVSENHHKYRNGNRVALKGVFHKHKTGFVDIMKYDRNNNLISLSSSGFYNSNYLREYKYDELGREILEVFSNGKNVVKTETKYDKQNNIIEEIRNDKLSNKTTVYKNTYKYDDNLNWISKKSYYKGKLRKIELREITYYD